MRVATVIYVKMSILNKKERYSFGGVTFLNSRGKWIHGI